MGGDKWSVAALPSPSPSPSPLRSPRHRRALSAHANVWPHCRARCRGRGATMGGPLGARWRRVGQKRGRWGGGGSDTRVALPLPPPCHLLVWGRGGAGGTAGTSAWTVPPPVLKATVSPEPPFVLKATVPPKPLPVPKATACPQSHHHVPKATMSPKPPPVPKATMSP